MEIWLLFGPQRVQAAGELREKEVITGGKHGVVIERGDQRGLLLPGVALEHGWDARTFLEHACRKAGLPISAWKDEATIVSTFEGEAIPGPVAEGGDLGDLPPVPPAAGWSWTSLEFCRSNLRALLLGLTPIYYLDAADGTVAGVAITVQRPVAAQPLTVSQISLRPECPCKRRCFPWPRRRAARPARGQRG